MDVELLSPLVLAGPAVWAFVKARKSRHPLMLQWGGYTDSRQGLKNHEVWSDEAEVVEFENFKYWLRLKPNPGINLPILGYWSRARGRRR